MNIPDNRFTASKTSHVTFGMAVLSLVTSGYLVLKRETPPILTPPPQRQDIARLEAQVQTLQNDMSALSAQLAKVSTQLANQRSALLVSSGRLGEPAGDAVHSFDNESADQLNAETENKPPRLTPSGLPLYTHLSSNHSAITVQQVGDGSLSVNNTDPSLTGQVLTVQAITADGISHDVQLIAPPPGK